MKENSLDLKDLNVLPAPRTPEGLPLSQNSLTGSGEEPQKVGPRNQQSVEKRAVHDNPPCYPKFAKRRSQTFVEGDLFNPTLSTKANPIPADLQYLLDSGLSFRRLFPKVHNIEKKIKKTITDKIKYPRWDHRSDWYRKQLLDRIEGLTDRGVCLDGWLPFEVPAPLVFEMELD